MYPHLNQKDFSNADRIIDKHELKQLVPYSHVHISRLEKQCQFPQRIQLGANRVGWSLEEIKDWIETKKLDRDPDKRPSDTAEGK